MKINTSNSVDEFQTELPQLTDLGKFSDLTAGSGGSSMDGNGNFNQLGGGNDDSGPNSNNN